MLKQKFPTGTMVQILPNSHNTLLTGLIFGVTEYRIGNLRLQGELVGLAIPIYLTPFESSAVEGEYCWVSEEFLKEIDIDEGFEFEAEWRVWEPYVHKEDICQSNQL